MNRPYGLMQTLRNLRRGPVQGLVVMGLVLAVVALVFPTETSAQKVLVSGGRVSASATLFTNTAEVYDPATATWTLTANAIPNPPPDSVGGLCAPNMALLGNNFVLLAGGGCSDQGITTNAASLYIPDSNRWTATTFMNFGRDQFGMVTLSDGNALAFAGCAGGCLGPNILGQGFLQVGPSAEIYNFSTNQWTTEASLNTSRGNLETNFSNLYQLAVVLQDGRVLTCDGSDGNVTPRTDCEIYDPVANSWTLTAQGVAGATSLSLLPSGKVLAVLNDGLSAMLFDPTSGTWSATGSLGRVQVGGLLVELAAGRILICGGTDGINPVNTVQIYDPSTGQWSLAASMNLARMEHSGVLLADGRLLVAGGQTLGSLIVSSAEIFDPLAGSWSLTTSMTQARSQANALLLGGVSRCSVSPKEVGLTITATVQCIGNFVPPGNPNNLNQQIIVRWNDPNGDISGTGSGGGSNCGVNGNTCAFSPSNTYPSGAGTSFTIQVDTTDAASQTTTIFQTINVGPITVTVSPNPVSVLVGATQQFTAAVVNATDTTVTWLVNGGMGDSVVGTINSSGLYTAPATVPTGAVTVTARSNADGTTPGSATVQIQDFSLSFSSSSANVAPAQGASSTVTVSSVNGFTGTVILSCTGLPSGSTCSFNTGSGFTPGPAPVTVPANGTVTSALNISTSAATPVGSYSIPVTGTISGVSRSQTFTLGVVLPSACGLALAPTSQSFGAAGGTGTITVTTLCDWLASSNFPSWITVTSGSSGAGNGTIAYSVAANSTSAQRTGTITVVGAGSSLSFTINQSGQVAVTISPNPVSVQTGLTTQFTASVINTSNTAVTWSVGGTGCQGGPCGTIGQAGLYTAPKPGTLQSGSQIDTVTATSQALSTATDSAPVTVFEAPSVPQPTPPQTVSAGQSASYVITVAPNTGDTKQATALSCKQSSLPNGVTCNFNPPQVTFGPNGASFQLAVNTTGQSAMLTARPDGGHSTFAFASLLPLAGVLLLGIGNKKRKLVVSATALVLCVCLLFVSACSTNGTFGTPPNTSLSATPQGQFTIVIVGQTSSQQTQGLFTVITSVTVTVH